MRASTLLLFLLAAALATGCAIEPTDYDEFNIACSPGDADACPSGFFCSGATCQRQDGGGGSAGAGADIDGDGILGGGETNDGGGQGGLAHGGGLGGNDCDSGFLDRCAGVYQLDVVTQILDEPVRSSSPVVLCGDGDLIGYDEDGEPRRIENAIAGNGRVSYVDEESGFTLTGEFRLVRCEGSGTYTILGQPDFPGGDWTLTRGGGA